MICEAELRDFSACGPTRSRTATQEGSFQQHTAATEARLLEQQETAMEVGPIISEPTLTQFKLRRPYCLDCEGTSQSVHIETPPEPMETMETTTLPDVNRGTKPKKPCVLSIEKIEGKRAQEWRDIVRDGERRSQRVPPLNRC